MCALLFHFLGILSNTPLIFIGSLHHRFQQQKMTKSKTFILKISLYTWIYTDFTVKPTAYIW